MRRHAMHCRQRAGAAQGKFNGEGARKSNSDWRLGRTGTQGKGYWLGTSKEGREERMGEHWRGGGCASWRRQQDLSNWSAR